ncbi:MAG: phosphotransferase [Bacteroidales bacterium]|nr:phosphotransferase [Bacteroidales bacterium]
MERLLQLFNLWHGSQPDDIQPLGANGSNRRYARLTANGNSCIGAINDDVRENEAFFAHAAHLTDSGINVPQVYAISPDRTAYLQQDLGDTTLYAHLFTRRRQGGGFDTQMMTLYRRVLADLRRIHLSAPTANFSVGYPSADFDRQAMLWDLNYYKYSFLKPAHISFDEARLEADFEAFISLLLQADCSCFMYRDFQSRNIMLIEQDDGLVPYYIDFQGARRGAAQYDVASLLYSAKSDIPEPIRLDLLRHYASLTPDPSLFLAHFWPYVYLRIMQAFGAYGFRGLCEHKDYFIKSIPLATNNLRRLVEQHPLPIHLPELQSVWAQTVERFAVAQTEGRTPTSAIAPQMLVVDVTSFSYKKGLPDDPSGNGGGFVFDCRALPNPGRIDQYKPYTGLDASVISYLAQQPPVEEFLKHVQAIVSQSVEKYIERGFSHLSVAFGCTGGQHRSVYCAEQTAQWLAQTYNICVNVNHREQGVGRTIHAL